MGNRPCQQSCAVLKAGLCLTAAGLGGLYPLPAYGHPSLAAAVGHRLSCMVRPGTIDITLELTFHELRSLEERRRMDTDGDGTITPAEIATYLARLGVGQGDLYVSIDGEAVTATPLYDPELDLGGTPMVVPRPHVLRLFYFARRPAGFGPGSEVVITDAWWPDVPTMGFYHEPGGIGLVLVPLAAITPPTPAEHPRGPVIMHLRCVERGATCCGPVYATARVTGRTTPATLYAVAGGAALVPVAVVMCRRTRRSLSRGKTPC